MTGDDGGHGPTVANERTTAVTGDRRNLVRAAWWHRRKGKTRMASKRSSIG